MSLYKNENIKSIEYMKNNVFRIKWRLTGWCNYHCPYCINGTNKEDKGDWNTTEQLIVRAKKINNFIKYNNITKPIYLNLIGGEVTFLDLKAIISEIEGLAHINITTNFSRPVEYFKDMFLWLKARGIKLFLHCSYHAECPNYKERFIELTNWCKENHFSTPRGSFVVSKDDDIVSLLKEYRDAGITKIVAQKMKTTENWHLPDLEVSQQDALTKANQEYENIKINQPKDYKVTFKDGTIAEFKSISNFLSNLDEEGFIPNNFICYAGFNGILINWDGKAYRTNCQELEGAEMGNIDNDIIYLPTKPILCTNKSYRCWLHNGTSVYRNEGE